MGVKCSRKHERNLDSARPPSPVTGEAENWWADESALSADMSPSFSLLFRFASPACWAWSLAVAAKPRGRPSFLLVEYVHWTPPRRHREHGISPEHLHCRWLGQQSQGEQASQDKNAVSHNGASFFFFSGRIIDFWTMRQGLECMFCTSSRGWKSAYEGHRARPER